MVSETRQEPRFRPAIKKRRCNVTCNTVLGLGTCGPAFYDSDFTSVSGSGEIEAIRVHHLIPCRNEVTGKLLVRIGLGVHLRNGAQL